MEFPFTILSTLADIIKILEFLPKIIRRKQFRAELIQTPAGPRLSLIHI